MRKMWRKLREYWRNCWKDEDWDAGTTHLSREDKSSLLYGGFMIACVICILVSIGNIIGNVWADYRNEKAMEEVTGIIAAYMATATEDEYEQIARTIRHDLVLSQYGQDMEEVVSLIPNTADGCCLEREGYLERVNLVFLNTGEAYGLDIFNNIEPVEKQKENTGTMLSFGYDEISDAQVTIIKNPDRESGTASIDCGRGIVSVQKMKSRFCDGCIEKILAAVEDNFMDEAVIYDAEEKRFFPVAEGEQQIGDYLLSITYESGGYEIEIDYTAK